jgi:cellulose synthase/poly-beta-1,6-N-acetylglucosamine synthase-like glycosyltransferase
MVVSPLPQHLRAPVPTPTPDEGAAPQPAEGDRVGTGNGDITLTLVMPTVRLDGDFETSACRALECLQGRGCAAEFIVAIDGLAITPPVWLDRPHVKIVATGSRSGPAVARNAAVAAARGEILFFVDADVVLAPDAVERVLAAFAAAPDLAGVFGAYDDEPAAPGLVSQFRNLLHHHTHISHPGPATTFWTGCGAIRLKNILAVGGFDTRFTCPSIEDIDLGWRVTAAGGRIVIDPDLRCKHLKQWTLWSMICTDVFARAVPWTQMLVTRHQMPATLAIDWKNRLSGVLALLFIAAAALAPFAAVAAGIAAVCGASIAVLHRDFYRLCQRKRGAWFALAAFALHVLFFVYSSLTFGVVALGRARGHSARQPTTAREST